MVIHFAGEDVYKIFRTLEETGEAKAYVYVWTCVVVLQQLRKNNLTLNKDKCEFNKTTIEFYGYLFSAKGVSADPKKIESIQNASNPRNATELSSLLGLVNYVSRFIPDYATITAPLRELTRKNARWQWNSRHQQALDEIKRNLTSRSVMAYFDPNKQTEVQV